MLLAFQLLSCAHASICRIRDSFLPISVSIHLYKLLRKTIYFKITFQPTSAKAQTREAQRARAIHVFPPAKAPLLTVTPGSCAKITHAAERKIAFIHGFGFKARESEDMYSL